MALRKRDRGGLPRVRDGLILLANVGSQYTWSAPTERLGRGRFVALIGSVGDVYDNGPDGVDGRPVQNRVDQTQPALEGLSQIELATAEWVDW